MTRNIALLALMSLAGVAALAGWQEADPPYAPQRVNKAIELFEQDQPTYYTQVNGGGYDEGKQLAETWADYITYNYGAQPVQHD